jgi:predicted ATPase
MLERGHRKRPYPHTVRALADALDLLQEERTWLMAAVPRRNRDASRGQVAASPTILPAPLTPLLGRESEVAEIARLLGGGTARLLTLTGPGGIGKTRLAVEAAREASEHFAGAVAFVALAPLRDAALVVPTVAQALGLGEAVGMDPLELLSRYLRERRFLLVLDNLEHVAGVAADVALLLGSCPGLSVLATSRAPLRVRGEREYPVYPLAVPDPGRAPTAEEVARTPAARLFAGRARGASPNFRITPTNAAAVAAICWRLDGMPLAIELAAAQVRFLGPTALLSRLDQALQAGGARDLPERQRTMRATLDWSHELLSKAEKVLFARLSVFAGGWTLEAAEAVGGAQEPADEQVLVQLGRLVEQSLILAELDRQVAETRYRMLEPVRQYAFEKLEESGGVEEARRRHAAFLLALAEEAAPRIKGHEQVGWLDRLEAENDNLRTAISWSLEGEDAAAAARFGWALGMYWVMRGRHGEGRLLMEQTLERNSGDLPALTRARTLLALAFCVYGFGDDERLMAIAKESVTLFRQAGDEHGEAHALGMAGFAAMQMGDLDRASHALERSLEGFREHEDVWGSAQVLAHMATVPLRRGDYQRTAELAEEALALARRGGDRQAINVALHLLARVAWATGEHGRAARYWRESLTMASELTNTVEAAYCMQGLAAVAASKDEPLLATRLLGAAEALLEDAGLILYAHASDEFHQRAAVAAREMLGERGWEEAHAEGRAMTFQQAVEYALEGDKA